MKQTVNGKTIDDVIADLIEYYAGSKLEGYSDEQMEIIALSNAEWDKLECDSEGPSKEQEKEQDLFLENTAKKILNLSK